MIRRTAPRADGKAAAGLIFCINRRAFGAGREERPAGSAPAAGLASVIHVFVLIEVSGAG
jgi:hypothetical protein